MDEALAGLGGLVVGVIFGAAAGFFIGATLYELVFDLPYRRGAIDAGAAYYACASDTGKCTFTWKAPQP